MKMILETGRELMDWGISYRSRKRYPRPRKPRRQTGMIMKHLYLLTALLPNYKRERDLI